MIYIIPKLRNFIVLFLLLIKLNAHAQKTDSTQALPDNRPGFFKGWAISANAGTLGLGASLNKRLSKHWSFTLGYFSSDINQKIATKIGPDDVNLLANAHVGAGTFFLELYPSVKSSFRLVTGCALNQNRYNIDITPAALQNFGLIVYTPDQVGQISFDLTGANIAPYLGLGFGRAIPKHFLGLALDLGTFYHGDPVVKMHSSGSFTSSDNPENQKTLENAFKGYAFYPFVNLKITLRISK